MSNPKVFVDDSQIHGKGLFAKTFIPAGEEIGTIEGEYTESDGDYVLWVNDQTGILVESDMRYINHSDNPNAAYYDDLTVYALKDINPGKEITHNYHQSEPVDEESGGEEEHVQTEVHYRQHWLPWLLLLLSWSGMAAYLVFSGTGL
ncbi:SET domain-containing protein [Pseudomonadota bacterium]